ncbi:hypothetical protein [Phenylobacterium sp.]|uniref:hypothetical protein n=1 Tax=Phenylobacterium sp. TaxID=1871053 RepID=UPI00121991D9|nr:hypothetical protein [Phenylobacterium sp.]THD61512.1 MAG: hypothetical protein E8A49_11055 [Phenylobacterium sp.]
MALTLLIAPPLCACTPQETAQPDPAIGLDCALPFDAQATKITVQAGLVPAPHDPLEPYKFYSTPHGRVSYLITEPGAPGHPAIAMEVASQGKVDISGCPYGDPKGYAKIMAYLESLKTVTHR